MNAKIDRSGQRYGRLLVLREGPPKVRPGGCVHVTWVCRCDCGVEKIVAANKLATKYTQSCGCLAAEKRLKSSITHGMSKTLPYAVWRAIKDRCFCKANDAYPRYGGRGITMCDEWVNDFEAFYAYVGERPSPKYSLDRINNDGNYEPGNVRWATRKQQANNRRPRTRKPRCHLGHDLTPENTYVQKKTGYRYCRKCKAIRDARYKREAA